MKHAVSLSSSVTITWQTLKNKLGQLETNLPSFANVVKLGKGAEREGNKCNVIMFPCMESNDIFSPQLKSLRSQSHGNLPPPPVLTGLCD